MKPPKKTSGKLLPVQKKKPSKTKVQNLKELGSKLAQSPVALRVLLAHLVHLVHLVRLEQLAHVRAQRLPGLAGPTGRNRARQRQTAQPQGSKVRKPATPSTMCCATCLQTPLPAVFLKIFTVS